MDRYNFRTTSLNNAQLNTELTKRGAKTFGTVPRKQQRLQRFIDAETSRSAKQTVQRERLRVVIQNEQRKVHERSQARAEEVLHAYNTRSKRGIISLIREYLY
jgi:RNase P/RNase MRP subunit POP5